ncbi:MAG: ATP-binding protein [Bacteroidales bacterium]
MVLDMRAANLQSKNARALADNVFSYDGDEILKTVIMYGANASGKSNVIKAIRFCCMMILNSSNHNENVTFNYRKFKFANFENKPSSFLIDFVMHGIEYEYAFTLMQDRILTESLYYYPKGRIKKIFTREEEAGNSKRDKYSFGSEIKRPFDVAENTSNKTLYLSRASQMDRELAKDLFRYFDSTFILAYLGHNARQVETLFQGYKQSLLKALQIADSDIVNIAVKKISSPGKAVNVRFSGTSFKDASVEDTIQEQLQVKTYHQSDPKKSFDLFAEESEGTKKLFVIMLSILDIISNDKVLMVDEIGESLHPDIIEYIFNLFRASRKAQLICTTHNTRFLDLTRFRKDQFYFVNKKEDASTDLYSLYDYSDFRDTMDLEKAYLQGRFDAVPYINDSIENLKQFVDGS